MKLTFLKDKQSRIIVIMLIVAALSMFVCAEANAETAIPVSARINSSDGANIRAKASVTSKLVTGFKNNKKITINYELFTTKSSTKAKKVWYNVTASGKTGFVRKDLVDSYTYTAVSGVTTDALNYRVGAGAEMERIGTLKKGAKVNVVGIAYARNTSDKWYKIKKGKKYYYVSAYWVKLTTTEEKTETDDKETTTDTDTDEEAKFTTTDITSPSTIAVGCKFSITGTVACNLSMTAVKVGVMNSSNKWVTSKTFYAVGNSFDISSADSYIRFGKLSKGTYQYRVIAKVNGTWHEVIGKNFKVAKVIWSTHLGDTAVSLAWPLGTALNKIKYSTGEPTAEYKAALDMVYPNLNRNTRNGAGASCDVFIGTVCRYSGYDEDMPSGLTSQQKYLAKSDKWQVVDYSYNESELQHGDICTYTNNNGNKHICMYVVINGEGYIAEASYTQPTSDPGKYGFINTDLNKVLKSSRAPNIVVYRAAS